MNDEFQSIDELYQRVLPALHTKVHKLSMRGIFHITEDDIWIFLMEKWKRGNGLTLFDMVHDILNLDERSLLDETYKQKDNTQ